MFLIKMYNEKDRIKIVDILSHYNISYTVEFYNSGNYIKVDDSQSALCELNFQINNKQLKLFLCPSCSDEIEMSGGNSTCNHFIFTI